MFLIILGILLALGGFFYMGLFVGYKFANHLIKLQLNSTNGFILGDKQYKAHEHCDLGMDLGTPDVILEAGNRHSQAMVKQ